jgi:hypothetical protein
LTALGFSPAIESLNTMTLSKLGFKFNVRRYSAVNASEYINSFTRFSGRAAQADPVKTTIN